MKTMTLLFSLFLAAFLTPISAFAACPEPFASMPMPTRCEKAKAANKQTGRPTASDVAACCDPPKNEAPPGSNTSSSGKGQPPPPPPPKKSDTVSLEDFTALKAKVDSFHPDPNGAVSREELTDWTLYIGQFIIGALVAIGFLVFLTIWNVRKYRKLEARIAQNEVNLLNLGDTLIEKGVIDLEEQIDKPKT